jgi:hypothetical protein
VLPACPSAMPEIAATARAIPGFNNILVSVPATHRAYLDSGWMLLDVHKPKSSRTEPRTLCLILHNVPLDSNFLAAELAQLYGSQTLCLKTKELAAVAWDSVQNLGSAIMRHFASFSARRLQHPWHSAQSSGGSALHSKTDFGALGSGL